MASTSETDRENADAPLQGACMNASELEVWFLSEVLPLEAALMRYLQHNWRNQSDIKDLLQDVYVRVCESARKEKPRATRPFVFTTARNLLINRVRDSQVIPIEAVADLEALSAAADEPGPDRGAIARDELRRLQAAIDRLPPRAREAVTLRQIEGLSRREIAARMNISEETVKEYLASGLRALSDMFFHGESRLA
jgi:RNA polymerase sigma-70 factor (ECF subfamily)